MSTVFILSYSCLGPRPFRLQCQGNGNEDVQKRFFCSATLLSTLTPKKKKRHKENNYASNGT
ncbi:hypothetical protein PAL_GLEAN10010852 [Pteropus alecto]|uniref:Uncharacterized protein n=1 Tax=Pteropus alecto TaxID=9402 RepID=L5KXP9_PTEAL|nr:hypothetical protein PAL_GLEAN10010852 [Pteropus alecto]